MRLVPACLAALLLAGCSDAPPSDEGADGASDLVSASGSASGTPQAANGTLPVLSTVPISWEGRTKEGAWVCSDQDGVAQCLAGQQVMPDGEHVTAIAYAGNATRLDVNLTWHADPTQPGLVLAAYANTTSGLAHLAHVRGPAPLRLQLGEAGLVPAAGGDAIVLMVWPQGKTPTSPSVFVDATRQDFAVEGSLLVLVPA